MSLLFCIVSILCLLNNVLGLNMYRPPRRKFKTQWSSTELPGLDYISRGYNIMFGNPHSTGNVDGGISGVIFNLQNASNGQTYGNYSIPNGVSVLASPTCTQTFTYNAVTGVNSYASSLSQDISVQSTYPAAFSASVNFQEVYTKTTTTESVYTSSYTQCAVYAGSLNAPYDLPAFTSNFIETVYKMPDFYDMNNETNNQFFYNFFTKYFGTHYIIGITMGGIFGTLSSMDSFSYSSYSSSNLDIEASASFSTLTASAAAESMTNISKSEATDFDSITTSKQVFNIGGDLPADNDPITWQKTLSLNPSPIYYKFDIIPNLLVAEYFSNVNNISAKKSALQSALNVYCSLLANNNTFGKIDCSGYPPDPSIPGKSILKGFYGENINEEPVNPYTSEYSCNIGFDSVPYFTYWDNTTSQHYTGYYCLNSTMNKTDELNYFGGFYEKCTDNKMNSKCNLGNYMIGGGVGTLCECPDGFTSYTVSEGISNYYQSNCWNNNNEWTILETFICYNKSVSLDKTIMAGMYTSVPLNGNCGRSGAPNQYTKTTSCQIGFIPYITGHQCCYSHNGKCTDISQTYMCLSNIYPI